MSQYGFYREVQLATSLQAKVLVDSNGRLILNSTNDVIYALVWNEESGIIDVDSEGRYNTQLAEWITNFGESQYSYIFNGTNQYTIIADSDEEDIEFNDATGEWAPTLTEWVPSPFPLKWRNVSWFDYKVLVNSQGDVLTNDTDIIIETGLEAQVGIRVNVAQNAHGAIPAGTSEVMCEITGDIQPGQTGDFTFVYEGQTYNVVNRIVTPEITDIYEE